MGDDRSDVVVVGGGIVGLATARRLLQVRPGSAVVVLEKEPGVGRHQTGHNSGVIHAGVYYAPGSLKARLCRAGAAATKEFCDEHGIAYRVPGKLVVATDAVEVERLGGLRERATANGLDVAWLDAAELRRREPRVTGRAALLVRETGIVDYRRVARKLAELVVAAGGRVEVGAEVTAIRERPGAVDVVAAGQRWTARRVVVCGGLQADRLARLAGLRPTFRILPFRGEYYRLPDHHSDVVAHLVYPVPDPALPFLGVHLTPMADGSVTVGPNAVLGLAREGYRKGAVAPRDVADYLRFPGTWRVGRTYWRTGVDELRGSLSRRAYLAAARRYCPDLVLSDLLPHEAGVRAQAVLRDGTLVHDFLLEQTDRTLHVCNAPSPAATSALPIADLVVSRLLGSR
ncbi:MAG: L-2-hydroxyglutarate oxidase [Actinomycetes bacterium]